MKWEYALFNAIIVFAPIISGLLYKKTVWPPFSQIAKSILPAAVVYILADQLVTPIWWSFNPNHILGIYLLKLPLEEIAFFFSVPFACLFLYINLHHTLNPQKITFPYFHSLILSLLLIIFTLKNSLWYTSAVLLTTILMFLLDRHSLRLYSQKTFIIFAALALILTTIFNGYLTARPVVIYNPSYKSNIQLGSIPIEDFVYGLTLIYFVVFTYTTLCSRSDSNTRPTA